MKVWVGIFLGFTCVCSAVGQQQLGRRDDGVVAAPPPAPMTPPEKREPAKSANADVLYQALRARTPNGTSFAVKDLKLKRDAGEFTFSSGAFYLYTPVNGLVTGAIFIGEGSFHVEPPSAMEKRQLKAVMKTEILDQRFTSAVMEFTDGTATELQRGSSGPVVGAGAGAALGISQEALTLFRRDLRYDLEERLLEDVEHPAAGNFFMADMKGAAFSKRLLYVVDPEGAVRVAPEEVGLLTSSDFDYDVTLSFRSETQRKLRVAADNNRFKIPQQTIDATIEKSGRLTATTVTAVTALKNGVQVLPLQMFPTLRVSGVWGPNGESLDFIQEDKMKDADFAVVLRKPLAAGEAIQITTSYAGKDAVLSEGGNNFYLVAREDWYPNMRGAFGNYAHYTMTFHTPRDVQVVATGNRVTEHLDGKQNMSVWQSQAPIPVAGFNMGEFKIDQSEANKNVQVISYANKDLADRYSRLSEMPETAMGSMSTTGMLQRATSEGDAAVNIYTDYFGPLPYDHISLTQQTACNYGQSWPTLVYLPICYFWDSTIKNQLGLLHGDPTYWDVVTPHEVAHQWWGQTVGFASYRDQWMSEGFANFSTSLFLQKTNKTSKEFRDFWTLLRQRLLEKNADGYRPVDVGPVVMGTRVSTSKTGGNVYQMLIYSKGAYILHMLRMMYWSPQTGDQAFKVAMHDFVNTYRNKPATTEDFKAAMERNMPRWMDMQGTHRLDWFFDAYVYGTEVPKYTVTSEFTKNGDDTTTMHFKVTQSGVSDDFRMLVPVYVEFEDKRVIELGRASIKGSQTVEQTINLGKLNSAAKRALVNYNFDLLAE